MITIKIGTLSKLIEKRISSYLFEDSVEIIRLEGHRLNAEGLPDVSIPLQLDSLHIILTLAGAAHIEVNSETYELHRDTIVDLIGVKVLQNVTFTDDYKGYHLIVNKSFYDDIFKEGKHLTPKTAMYKMHFPYDTLQPQESRLLEECILNIIKTIERKEHVWYRRMVEATVRILFIEIGNILIPKMPLTEEEELSKYDVLFYRFMQLVHENGKERKPVKFYADKLCLSPDYLAQVVKAFTQKPISYWINEELIAQAKSYLTDPHITIQQIVERMNFADQSSFGRFFKKNTGLSPAEYRKLSK